MQTQQINKTISFSPAVYQQAIHNARDKGVSLERYLELLVEDDTDTEQIEVLDDETVEEVGIALKEVEEGKYTEVKTKEELEKYLARLSQ